MSEAAPASPGAFLLDPHLEHDTVAVGDLPLSRVLLMNDASFPWLIAVPRHAGAMEIFDLGEAERAQLMSELALLARLFKDLTGCDKINIAAIGNVVSQLHVHVVARRRDDPLWPRPVWGAQPPRPYEAAEREQLLRAIRRKIAFA
ncbi:MAG TPA: HIT family protein [Xanthobacteraceae bacterium]|nr:HIT family protein [Xanthobacteraceae bacterium]